MRPSRLMAVSAVVAVVVGVVPVVVAATPASAADACEATWVGPPGGAWGQAANWSPAQVPDGQSVACLPAGASAVLYGSTTVQKLVMTRSSLRVDGTLNATFRIVDSDLSGAGTITSNFESETLSGVQVGGTLTIDAPFLTVSGRRSMCGAQLSVCLTGGSRITADITLQGAVIGGDTTARPAVSGGVHVEGSDQRNRILVDLDAPTVDGRFASASSLRLDQWEQLAPDGTLSADLVRFKTSSPLTVARGVVNLDVGTLSVFPGAITLPNGRDALRGLTSVASWGQLQLADDSPRGGTLTLQPGPDDAPAPHELTLGSGTTAATVQGSIVNRSVLELEGEIHADALVDDATVAGDARTTCARLDGDLSVTAPGTLATLLAVPAPGCAAMYTVTGTASLVGTLRLSSPPRAVPVGTTVVILDAAGGRGGRFASITGQDDGHGNHWAISYTATQVVATLVAGTG